jgi:CxxC motif-containing protein (DUF1111 family)
MLATFSQVVLTPGHVSLSQRNAPALFGTGLIDTVAAEDIEACRRRQVLYSLVRTLANRDFRAATDAIQSTIPKQGDGILPLLSTAIEVSALLLRGTTDFGPPVDRDEPPIGRVPRRAGRVGRFGWKGQSADLAGFVRAACASELGLGNPGHAQARPLFTPNYEPPGLDLTDRQCDQLTRFIASLPRPEERAPEDATVAEQARSGKELFRRVGCAECHVPDLGKVKGLYSDLLLHDMGSNLQGGGFYGALLVVGEEKEEERRAPGEWRTPPLWGLADSAPYLHDGRAATLEEAILQHAGQAAASMKRFRALPTEQQAQLVAFLKTLRAPAAR